MQVKGRNGPGAIIREGQRLASVQQAADMLGITRQYTHALLREGTLRSIRLGRRRLIPLGEIDKLIEERLGEELLGKERPR